tara:strand:- start:622 stop:1578 length:957 start_codon:yes stop_codon:yes gene_type:complete
MISSTLTKQEFEKKFDFKMPKSDTVWTYNKSGEGLMSRTITKDEYGGENGYDVVNRFTAKGISVQQWNKVLKAIVEGVADKFVKSPFYHMKISKVKRPQVSANQDSGLYRIEPQTWMVQLEEHDGNRRGVWYGWAFEFRTTMKNSQFDTIEEAKIALDMENVLIDSIICNWDNGVDERQYNTWGYTQTTKSMEKTIRVNKLHLLPGMLKHHIMKMNETLETYVVDERSSIITKLLDQWTHPSWKQTHEYFENKIQQLKDEKHVLQERSRRNQANKGLASEIKVMKAEIVKFEKIAKEIDSDINDFSDGELVKLIKGCK